MGPRLVMVDQTSTYIVQERREYSVQTLKVLAGGGVIMNCLSPARTLNSDIDQL